MQIYHFYYQIAKGLFKILAIFEKKVRGSQPGYIWVKPGNKLQVKFINEHQMQAPLFFIAILPCEHIQREVTCFKQDCARLFKASHALKSPPHLTLIPPFPWPLARLGVLGESLSNFAGVQFAFDIELVNFNCFEPRVIFVNVLENQQLNNFQSALFHHLELSVGHVDERAKRFHPHVTIAHRDLHRSVFEAAWAYFSNMEYKRTFKAERITLLEHVKGRWEIFREYLLNG